MSACVSILEKLREPKDPGHLVSGGISSGSDKADVADKSQMSRPDMSGYRKETGT